VDDDLAFEPGSRHVPVGIERDAHGYQVAVLRRVGDTQGAGVITQLELQAFEGLRSAGVGHRDLVAEHREVPGERTSDLTSTDESDGRHASTLSPIVPLLHPLRPVRLLLLTQVSPEQLSVWLSVLAVR